MSIPPVVVVVPGGGGNNKKTVSSTPSIQDRDGHSVDSLGYTVQYCISILLESPLWMTNDDQ